MKIIHLAGQWIPLFALALSLNAPSLAEPSRALRTAVPSTQTANREADFDNICTCIAKEAKVAVIAEGSPLKPQLTVDELSALREQLQKSEHSPVKMMEAVADKFDYSVVMASPTTILLLKKYTNPHDLPDVTLAEAAIFLHNLRQAIGDFDPKGSPPELVKEALKTTTGEEGKELAKGKRFGDLRPELQAILRRTAMSGCIRSAFYNLPYLEKRLNGCLHGASFVWQTAYGLKFVGYRGSFRLNGESRDLALSYSIRSSNTGASYPAVPEKSLPVNGVMPPGFKDPSDPDINHTFPPKITPYAKTIAQCITEIVKGGEPQWIADKSIASKQVSLFGVVNAPAEEVMEGIARIYGLRIVKPSAAPRRLTTLTPQIVRTSKELTAEVRRLLPPALDRAAGITGPRPSGSDGDLYLCAVSRVRQIMEPLLAQNGTKPIPFTQAPEEATKLVALTTLLMATSDFQQFAEPLPEVLDKLDDARVELFVEDNMGHCRITMAGKGGVDITLPVPPGVPNPL